MTAPDASPDSALIVAIALPPGLERLRLRHVPDAASEGIPAHATLLYPFLAPAAINEGVLDVIRALVARHAGWSLSLTRLGRFPGTLYATVEPDAPIRSLQADLAAAFPSLPLYGEPGLPFVPHVTVAEGHAVGDPAVAADPAWSAELPVVRVVTEVQLIVRGAGRWRVAKAFPLGLAPTVSR